MSDSLLQLNSTAQFIQCYCLICSSGPFWHLLIRPFESRGRPRFSQIRSRPPPQNRTRDIQGMKNNSFMWVRNLMPLNFQVFCGLFVIFWRFLTNSEPFWVNSGTPWASFFDVFWGHQFCLVFCIIFQQISKE